MEQSNNRIGSEDLDVLLQLSDLSLTELITLQTVLRVGKPINRHHLYLEVLQFFDHKKTISTSSFYNSLKNMEEMGLIAYNLEGKKVKTVEAGKDTADIVSVLLKFLIGSSFDMLELEINFIQEIEMRIQKPSMGNILVIDTSRYIEFPLIHYLGTRSESITILSLDEVELGLEKLGMPNLYLSSLRDGKIREPDHAFDTIIVPVFTRELDSGNMSKIEMLSEMDRVLKSEGLLITTSFAEFPTTDNYFANTLLELYKENMLARMLTQPELEEDFSTISHERNDIFDYHGMLIGILWK